MNISSGAQSKITYNAKSFTALQCYNPENAVQPRRAADAAGAARNLGAIHPLKRGGLRRGARSFHSPLAAARALAGRGCVPPRVALSTPASGAADSSALGWHVLVLVPEG
jgi:hypothetical protein